MSVTFRLKPLTVAISMLLFAHGAGAQANTFTPLLPWDPDSMGSLAYGISGNGRVVVGIEDRAENPYALIWRDGTTVDLGTAGFSYANAASWDGSVIVGGNNGRAFRWTESDGMQDLGSLDELSSSNALGVSADGGTVVGSDSSGAFGSAFRWTASDGMTRLADLEDFADSTAVGVSGNGEIIVGYSEDVDGRQAVRWSGPSYTPAGLGFLESGDYSAAEAISADGQVIVGVSNRSAEAWEHRAFRWESGLMADLGTLGGPSSLARAVNANGSVVVGWAHDGLEDQNAFRWSTTGGMQSVRTWLTTAGVSVSSDYDLMEATGVSADGTVVVGNARNADGHERAWLARVTPAGSGILTDLQQFNAGIYEAGTQGMRSGLDLSRLPLWGAHHRSLLDDGLVSRTDKTCVWAVADAARWHKPETSMQLAEAGACTDVGPWRFGVGVGDQGARQDWMLNGSARFNGQYLILEAAGELGRLRAAATIFTGRYDATLRRNYLNGTAVDTSTGRSDSRAHALRLLLEWPDFFRLGSISFGPYAAYTQAESRIGAYTETGGGFPARFNARRMQAGDLVAGMGGSAKVSQAGTVRLALDVGRVTEHSQEATAGEVLGLWRFTDPGTKIERIRWRTTVDYHHRLSDDLALTAGTSFATTGIDPSWTVTLGIKANF